MIVLEGLPALSPFRRERLEARLQALAPALRIAGAWFTYWVEPANRAQAASIATRCIASSKPATRRRRAPTAPSRRYVLPRLGTISPWASKATELLHGADLPVKRVERGLRLDIAGWPDDAATQSALARLLHDPMTQSLVAERNAGAAMFATPERASLEVRARRRARCRQRAPRPGAGAGRDRIPARSLHRTRRATRTTSN